LPARAGISGRAGGVGVERSNSVLQDLRQEGLGPL
jgi:hypothetical protein